MPGECSAAMIKQFGNELKLSVPDLKAIITINFFNSYFELNIKFWLEWLERDHLPRSPWIHRSLQDIALLAKLTAHVREHVQCFLIIYTK